MTSRAMLYILGELFVLKRLRGCWMYCIHCNLESFKTFLPLLLDWNDSLSCLMQILIKSFWYNYQWWKLFTLIWILFSLQVCHCFPHQQFLHHGLHTDQKISTIIIIRLAYLLQDLFLSFYLWAMIIHKYTVTKHIGLCFPISISMITK